MIRGVFSPSLGINLSVIIKKFSRGSSPPDFNIQILIPNLIFQKICAKSFDLWFFARILLTAYLESV